MSQTKKQQKQKQQQIQIPVLRLENLIENWMNHQNLQKFEKIEGERKEAPKGRGKIVDLFLAELPKIPPKSYLGKSFWVG